MSKKAEQAALKTYPPTYTTVERHAKRVQSKLVDTHKPVRAIFQQGYEQAEKDTIERAVTWLKDNANKYIVDLTETYPDAPVNIIVGGMCWEDLTKYLKSNEQDSRRIQQRV